MIRRPPRSTLSSSSAASDVYKRQGINAEYGGLCVGMMQEHCRGILQVMVGQVCEQLGFDSVSQVTRDSLTDILQAYIEELGHVAHNAAELANRTEVNACDVLMAFDDGNVSLPRLRQYCEQADELPLCHELHQVPVCKRRRAVLDASGVCEDVEHIHAWLPKLPDAHTWRSSAGDNQLRKLGSKDHSRGPQMRHAEDVLLNLREAVPSAFRGGKLPQAKAVATLALPKADASNPNEFLRPATIVATENLSHGVPHSPWSQRQ
eukprot:TRINITY_DN631_c0_g2_i2.p1 TRINITY_DN631_c0_g2~~TRINITY_DN631_c0_g2_i2.p1  ORF type:complete len:263 (+),score=45.12 TRINITY_DN631_c0_g2_i2:85-873(+)